MVQVRHVVACWLCVRQGLLADYQVAPGVWNLHSCEEGCQQALAVG
jgi:hypothetical protein